MNDRGTALGGAGHQHPREERRHGLVFWNLETQKVDTTERVRPSLCRADAFRTQRKTSMVWGLCCLGQDIAHLVTVE